MDSDLLPVQISPFIIELGIDDRIHLQLAQLQEDPDWRLDLLQQRVRPADADVCLSADDSLSSDVFAFQKGRLDLDALLLRSLHGDEQPEGFDGGNIAE